MGKKCLLMKRQCSLRGRNDGLGWTVPEHTAATAAKSLQSCPTLSDPIDGSPPGSPVTGILQARPLEWVAISFSNAWKWEVKVKSLSCVWLLATPWTSAHQAPPSMGFSRQEYWSGVPLPSPVPEHRRRINRALRVRGIRVLLSVSGHRGRDPCCREADSKWVLWSMVGHMGRLSGQMDALAPGCSSCRFCSFHINKANISLEKHWYQ